LLLKDKRIFVVDDKPVHTMVASLYLQCAGAIVICDWQGNATPEAISKVMPVDLILLDLVLTKTLSGFNLLDKIRHIPHLANIPVVALSASDPNEALPLARKAGFDGYISKPLSRQIINNVVDVLAGKEVWNGDDWQSWIQESDRSPRRNGFTL
jgi:two-component system sensor histidine kinase EvgS